VDNVLTEPVDCFLCLKPFAHMYESKYQRMPCIGAQTNLDLIHEVYMKDVRYMKFANFLKKEFEEKRNENDSVRRRRLPFNWTKCLHFEFEFWKLNRAIEEKNQKDFEFLKAKMLKTFFEEGNALGIEFTDGNEELRIDNFKIVQELTTDLKLTDDLTRDKLVKDYEIGKVIGESNSNLCFIYKHDYYENTEPLNVCCCYCV